MKDSRGTVHSTKIQTRLRVGVVSPINAHADNSSPQTCSVKMRHRWEHIFSARRRPDFTARLTHQFPLPVSHGWATAALSEDLIRRSVDSWLISFLCRSRTVEQQLRYQTSAGAHEREPKGVSCSGHLLLSLFEFLGEKKVFSNIVR